METTVSTSKKAWSLDPTHSSIHFGVRHMVISETKGSFEKYSLKVESDGNDFSGANIELEIDVKSINTNMSDRDNHLRSADFFETEKFPTIRFISTSFQKINDEEFLLKGNMTIKDKTIPMEFKVNYGGQLIDPWGNLRAGFNLQGSINRFDFGLNWNTLMEAGGALVGKTVRLDATIEIVSSK